jgi:chemotaxis protein methyltransferase CheR
MNETDYGHLKRKIKQLIGIDLDYYKVNQMMRRLDGFISRSGVPGVVPYCSLLEQSPDEREKLRNFITINVSEFYRDVSYFNTLRTKIFPELLNINHNLIILSAGCSDGQEPYSIAILLTELSGETRHRIIATDIDKVSLDKAVAGGPYRQTEIKSLPRELMTKYFTLREDGYYVIDRIRSKVHFRQHDLIQDPFEIDFDLIICRNVVIYFSNEAKLILMNKFCNSLKDRGVLFIGATESILNAEAFGLQRLSPCFYRKFTLTSNTKSPVVPAFSVNR